MALQLACPWVRRGEQACRRGDDRNGHASNGTPEPSVRQLSQLSSQGSGADAFRRASARLKAIAVGSR